MEILGIGPSELFFIIIIALIVLGPRDMQKAGRSVGRWLNSMIRSDGWKAFQQTSRELRNLPNRLMREANMEMMEMEKSVREAMAKDEKHVSPPDANLPLPQQTENTIQPSTANVAQTDNSSTQQ